MQSRMGSCHACGDCSRAKWHVLGQAEGATARRLQTGTFRMLSKFSGAKYCWVASSSLKSHIAAEDACEHCATTLPSGHFNDDHRSFRTTMYCTKKSTCWGAGCSAPAAMVVLGLAAGCEVAAMQRDLLRWLILRAPRSRKEGSTRTRSWRPDRAAKPARGERAAVCVAPAAWFFRLPSMPTHTTHKRAGAAGERRPRSVALATSYPAHNNTCSTTPRGLLRRWAGCVYRRQL